MGFGEEIKRMYAVYSLLDPEHKYKKAAFMRMVMDGKAPPKAAIEAREV